LLGGCGHVLLKEAWESSSASLIAIIERNFELDDKQRGMQASRVVEHSFGLKKTTDLVHESEGWRNLDTTLAACVHLMNACGERVMVDANTERLISFTLRARDHPNRFMRETSLKLLTSLIDSSFKSDELSLTIGKTEELAPKVSESIAKGLEDNWSQVRYAASVCVRHLLEFSPVPVKERLYPLLIPRMCLNRHYVAEGVRLYSQETWRTVLGHRGRELLVENFAETVAYYETQCEADNHAVREAACQGFAELSTRINEAVVIPEVKRILSALIKCFRDESWPVRDCACTASSTITVRFPKEVEATSLLPVLVDLWFTHVADNVPSVRENSAMSLADAAGAYGESHPICGTLVVRDLCRGVIHSVESQPQDSTRSLLKEDSHFGAAYKLARDNDPELHTDKTLYSCGSLAPKLRKGGCMDHGFRRNKEPWEESDGALRLWGRLTAVSPTAGDQMFEDVVQLATLDLHFAHAPYLLETLWRQVAACVGVLNADLVSKSLPALARAMKTSETSGHRLTEAAAYKAENALKCKLGDEAVRTALAF